MESSSVNPQEIQPQANPRLNMQIPNAQMPMPETPSFSGVDIEALKKQARDLAIQQTLAQKGFVAQPTTQPITPVQQEITQPITPPPSLNLPSFVVHAQERMEAPPKIVYVKRNLTVAEIIVMFAISIFIVTGSQFLFTVASNYLPKIEIKVK